MKRRIHLAVFVFLMAALLIPAQQVFASGPWTTLGNHVVQYGDTLYCIGRAYGVDPWAIAAYNGINVVNANYIHPGTILQIPDAYKYIPPGPTCVRQFPQPPAPPVCVCQQYYTVMTGDNLMQIAALFNVNMWEIARCNNIYNLNYVQIGQQLCIPTSQ